MGFAFDFLSTLDAQKLPLTLVYVLRLLFCTQVVLLPLSHSSPFVRSRLPIGNVLYFRNTSDRVFTGIWATQLILFLLACAGLTIRVKYGNKPIRSWIAVAITVARDGNGFALRETVCWSASAVSLFVISLVGFVALLILALASALTTFELNPFGHDRLAAAHGRVDAWCILWLAASILLMQLLQSSAAFLVLVAIGALSTSVSYALTHPFYSGFMNKFHATLFAVVSWLAITGLVVTKWPTPALRVALYSLVPLPVAVAWLSATLRVRQRRLLKFDSTTSRWTSYFPTGIGHAVLESEPEFSPPHRDHSHDTTSADDITLFETADEPDIHAQALLAGGTIKQCLVSTDVELATRFLLTNQAAQLHRQGCSNLTPSRTARAMAQLGQQYYLRGIQHFSDNPLLRFHYARFLILWQNADDIANSTLSELIHDPTTPWDVRFLAARQQSALRGVLDIDASAGLLKKAKAEHNRALQALQQFLCTAKAKESDGGQVSALSNLAHVLCHRRANARDYYRAALVKQRKLPDRHALVCWALFQEQLMMDHQAAAATHDLIDRLDSSPVSQRSSATGSTAASASTDIPGLTEELSVDDSDNQVGGLAKLLSRNIQVAFIVLLLLAVTTVVFNVKLGSVADALFDRLLTVGRLRSLAYQAATYAIRTNSAACTNASDVTAQAVKLQTTGIALGRLHDELTQMSSFKSETGDLLNSHVTKLTPLRFALFGVQVTVRMTAIWEFGYLLANMIGNVLNTSCGSTGLDLLRTNAPAIGAAYNRTLWLYQQEATNVASTGLLGQTLLMLAAALVLAVTALVFLWSYTRIAQQRLVTLRFFAALPPDVLQQLAEATDRAVQALHTPAAVADQDAHDDGYGENAAGTQSDEDAPSPLLTGYHHNKGKDTPNNLPGMTGRSREGSRAWEVQDVSPFASANTPGTQYSSYPLSPGHTISPKANSLPVTVPRLATLGQQPRLKKQFSLATDKGLPELHVRISEPNDAEKCAPEHVRHAEPPSEPKQPLKPALKVIPARETTGKRVGRTIHANAASKRQPPYVVFLVSKMVFLLVCAAIAILITLLRDESQLQHRADEDVSAYRILSQLLINGRVSSRHARKYTFFGQLRRYKSVWSIEGDEQQQVMDLMGFVLAPEMTAKIFTAFYLDALNIRKEEQIALALTAACFNMSTYGMPEIMYNRWARPTNATVADSLTLQGGTPHSDYATDMSKPNAEICQMAQKDLFSSTYNALQTKAYGALETQLGLLRDTAFAHIASHANATRSATAGALVVFAIVLVASLAVVPILRLKYPLIWAYKPLRLLSFLMATSCVVVIITLILGIVLLDQERAAFESRVTAVDFVSQHTRLTDHMNEVAFQFTAFPDMALYNEYFSSSKEADTFIAEAKAFIPSDLLPLFHRTGQERDLLCEVDHIGMVLTANILGWLDRMPELRAIDWDGKKARDLRGELPRFTTRAQDTNLTLAEQRTLALMAQCDDVQTNRRNTMIADTSALEASIVDRMNVKVKSAHTLRVAIYWLVLAAAGVLVFVTLASSLVLALRALDLSGSQAIAKLNDAQLYQHIRRQRLALGLVAVLFLAMFVGFSTVKLSISGQGTLAAWVADQEGTVAQCMLHAEELGAAATNATTTAGQRFLSTCLQRLTVVQQNLFVSQSSSESDALTIYLNGTTTGETRVLGQFAMICSQLAAFAPALVTPQLLRPFVELVRPLFEQAVPLLEDARTAFTEVRHNDGKGDYGLHASLAAAMLLTLLLEYFILFRPMLKKLQDDQAIMRSLVLLIPESAMTADMEEFLESGIVNSADRMLMDDDLACPDGERVENEGEELSFMADELQALLILPAVAVVCSAEGTVLWKNRSSGAVLPSDVIGQHLSIILPNQAHRVLKGASHRPVDLLTRQGHEVCNATSTGHVHPRTGAKYCVCTLEFLKDAALTSFRQQVTKGVPVADAAATALETHACVVTTGSPGATPTIVHATGKMQTVTGKPLAQVIGSDPRALLANGAALPKPTQEGDGATAPFETGGYDVLVVTSSGGRPEPYFVSVSSITTQNEHYFVLIFHLVQRAQVTASETTVQQPQAPAKPVKQLRHTDMQHKRVSVLFVEYAYGSQASATIASSRSSKLLQIVYNTAAKNNGALHWAIGDVAIVTFNHSTCNGSHVLSACATAHLILDETESLQVAGEPRCLRLALASSQGYCGYYGRLPVLQAECLTTGYLLLRVLKEVPCAAVTDQTSWQAAQYAYQTRYVNSVGTVLTQRSSASPLTKPVQAYELGEPKEKGVEDEWMYELAQGGNPFEIYDQAVRFAQKGAYAEAKEKLLIYREKAAEDEVAKWLLSILESERVDQSSSAIEWCGHTAFRLEWVLPE
eukprot:TRINITY_DN5816_c0_g1_i9.p1 TRINITY_DN5816_c0_g1~~TRINITY_DN5816_c0_g1_i9.p1  ORF type:complete len:2359 (-),score=425.98 TRINITY_DN5816_c0_g1_i9:202-7278(-)